MLTRNTDSVKYSSNEYFFGDKTSCLRSSRGGTVKEIRKIPISDGSFAKLTKLPRTEELLRITDYGDSIEINSQHVASRYPVYISINHKPSGVEVIGENLCLKKKFGPLEFTWGYPRTSTATNKLETVIKRLEKTLSSIGQSLSPRAKREIEKALQKLKQVR